MPCLMQISYSKRTLSNGLDVIVHEDHQLPMVAVNIWYHVGSKNERPGRTGFAHLFEHLMFEGSEHHDHGYFPPLQRAGGLLNGSTNVDRTNYWEVVPTGALDLALWMESDRMGYLLPALTDQKFNNQRDVVLNERRQNYENRPYGLAGIALSSAMFPPDHPYHWPTIGSAEDIRAARLDHVREFFQTYYHPGQRVALAGRRRRDRSRPSSSPRNTSAACPPARRSIACASRRALTESANLVHGRSRRAAAALYQLAFAGDVREPTMPSSTSSPTCSRTARRRGSTRRSSTSAASRPTCRRISIRARWAACSRSRARPRRESRCRN